MSILAADEIPNLSLLYKLGKLTPTPANFSIPKTLSFSGPGPIQPSKALNNRVCVIRHDATKLAVDAITNAANTSLLGGGGIDGAIHAAAGSGLLKECRGLGGCATGDAKITNAYDLPAKKVIHAVGPIYDPVEPSKSEELLTSAYNKVLNLAVDHDCKSLVLCGISTGIYGYPPQEAAPVAISAVRKFLEGQKGQKLEKVVFVTWVKPDVDAYARFLPVYFPPVDNATKPGPAHPGDVGKSETDSAEVAEAEEVASKLPDVPRADPGDSEHLDKKQKQ